MNDRDCDNCAHHSDGGCSVWECSFEQKDDTISRQTAIDAMRREYNTDDSDYPTDYQLGLSAGMRTIEGLPSAQHTLYGYNIEHLKLIADVLRKENLPPERVAEALNDIGRIVEIVIAEFAETLRKAVEQCKI